MKKISHIMNIILCIALILVSIVLLIFNNTPNEGISILNYVSSSTCIIFTLITLLYGAIVPNRDVYLSSKYRKVGTTLYTASSILNKSVVSPSSLRVFNGEVPIKRFWTPMTSLIFLVLLGPLVAVNFTLDNSPLFYVSIVWFIVNLLLIIFETIWQNEYYKELYGRDAWKKTAKMYAIFFIVLLFIIIGTIIYSN